MATLDPRRILDLVPGAAIFANGDKEKIPYALAGLPPKEDFFSVSGFEGRTRAFVKIQDGCNLGCAYCLVPSARSAMKSKPAAAALVEVKRLIAGGFGEIVLCGTRLGMYECGDTGLKLTGLMRDIFGLVGDFWIRFSSLEPGDVSEELAAALKDGGEKFCDYFHLPLQAGSDAVLKAMRRPYVTAGYLKKLDLLRRYFREPGLFADIIAGYPSETGEHFAETLAFVKKCRFAGLHVFRFSRRAGTPAFELKPLDPKTVAARASALRALDAGSRSAYAASMRGRTLRTLVLRNRGGSASGLASNFLKVSFPGVQKPGSFVRVSVTGTLPGGAGDICLGQRQRI
jgi:threonylcarbamoyladenosine tRNA methylthiotransferase MtaB